MPSNSAISQNIDESAITKLVNEKNNQKEPAIVQVRVEPNKFKILQTKDGKFQVTAVSARLYGDVDLSIPKEAVNPLRPWTDFLVWQNRLRAALTTCPGMRYKFSPYIELAYTTDESDTPLRQVMLDRPLELRMTRYLRMIDTIKQASLSNEEFFHYMFGTMRLDQNGTIYDGRSDDDFQITREADESGKLIEVASPFQGLLLSVGEEEGERFDNQHFCIYLNNWIYLHKLSKNGPMWFSTGQGVRAVAGVSPHDRIDSYDCKLNVSGMEMFNRNKLIWWNEEDGDDSGFLEESQFGEDAKEAEYERPKIE